MKIDGQDTLLSESGLTRFIGYVHPTAIVFRYAEGERLIPPEDSQDAKRLPNQGDDHELRFLCKSKVERRLGIEFSCDGRVGSQQDNRVTREQGKRTLLTISDRAINEAVAKLLNTSALGLVAFESLSASYPNADAPERPPDWN
ncbi:hypothetical protein [Bradyrhizobium sp. SZCCHNRI3052]|uniref:hypothetical protein n=1 Tax=Bradyrhizobium sp. SZCCHNRI3052 TaxID=3057295 RepID=UPI0029161BE9|nr:hypothetical protein [Bradyrhizobium sp. SZCCHNRI3052]